jgi:hypothetical protein
MADPDRACRLWLAIVVATLWVLSVGGQAEATPTCSGFDELPTTHIARRTETARSRPLLHSCFAQGLLLILVALLQHKDCLVGRFLTEPWPSKLAPCKQPKRKGKAKKKKSRGQKQRRRQARRAFQGGFMKNLPVKAVNRPLLLIISEFLQRRLWLSIM